MIRIAKPRNARSKRALEKREAKEYESAKKAVFVRGPHSSDKVSLALREFALLKKPHAIPFSKANDVVPFEDASSLEFWGKKNDASLFLLANHQKKRPHNLTWARLFDGAILDMYEMGITSAKGHEAFTSKNSPTVGARPLFHFSGPHFATDGDLAHTTSLCTPGVAQSFQHIKSLFLDFYRGEEMPPGSGPGANPGQPGLHVALKGGLQHIITVTEGPAFEENGASTGPGANDDLEQLYRAGALKINEGTSSAMVDTTAAGRTVHVRVYAIVSGSEGGASASSSNASLEEIGPSFDFVLRRRQMPGMDRLSASLKRPKTHAEKNRQGKGKKKNIETDAMGDMVGRVHVGKQDLGKLQTRKMKGLKRSRQAADAAGDGDGDDDDDDDEIYMNDDDEELEFDGDDADAGAEDDDEEQPKKRRQ